MTLPTITTLPTPPSRGDSPASFNQAADALLNSFPGLVSEINAFGAALPATVSGIDYNGTSTSSLTVGTGSKAITTQTGKNFQIGQFVVVANTVTPSNYMTGQITAYNSGTGALVVDATASGGAGTFTAWTISIAPSAGSYATLVGAETLTNKTLTTPVLSATAAGTTAGKIGYSAGVVTFGDGAATRTLVTTDNTQTLTNKTFNAAVSSNVLKVNGNTVTASAGTATLTLPNSSDTIIGRATTDTLTNKTLTAPTINTPTMANGSWSGASITSGSVITSASASGGAKFRLTPGAAPSAPTNGDIWLTAAALFAQIGGSTQQLGTLRITGSSIGASGYIKLNDGTLTDDLIIQWKQVATTASGSTAFTWPTTFPNAVFVAVPGGMAGLTFSGTLSCYLSAVTASGGNAWGNNGGSVSTTTAIIAIGN